MENVDDWQLENEYSIENGVISMVRYKVVVLVLVLVLLLRVAQMIVWNIDDDVHKVQD
jgi:hypothetical protein